MNHLMRGTVNLLSFTAVDYGNADPTLEEVLKYLCPPEISSDVESIVQRYRAMGPPPLRLAVVPEEQEILNKIILPLRQAKASWVIGNYLAVIALCGMVAEMVAIFLWELEGEKLEALTKEDQKRYFRKTFETEEELEEGFELFGQKERVKLLLKYRLINPDTKSLFDEIRETRRKYLHLLSQDHDSLVDDAINVFHNAKSLVEIAVGAEGFQDGKVILSDRLLEYLKRQLV